jgi:hypothetical protein
MLRPIGLLHQLLLALLPAVRTCIAKVAVDGLFETGVKTDSTQHAKQASSITRPLHARLGMHAKLSPPTVTLHAGVRIGSSKQRLNLGA